MPAPASLASESAAADKWKKLADSASPWPSYSIARMPQSDTIGVPLGGFMFAAQVPTQRTIGVWFETHGIVAWLLLGLVAGWLAGKIARGRGFGCIADIVLGLIGSYLGGWIFTKLGIFGGGFLYSLAAATLGAVILVSIAHLFVGGNDR
jgi:uncharacterized membrane protein YeaQ/YmgE (transglycosylase-associated protein family)